MAFISRTSQAFPLNRGLTQGFTLIELLVVMAILALLASILLVSLNTARLKGRDSLRLASLSQFSKALDMYYDKYGVYPCGDANGPNNTTADSSLSDGFLDGTHGLPVSNCFSQPKTGLFSEGIISQQTPQDPINTTGKQYYLYLASGDRQRYVLVVSLEGQEHLARSAADNGLCQFLYETGTGVGVIDPAPFASFHLPCN